MADGQEQVPQMEGGASWTSLETGGGQGRPEQRGGDPGLAAHWCYQCNKEVAVEPEQDGHPGSMVCTDCRSGFIEVLVTAQTLPVQQRRARPMDESLSRSEVLEHLDLFYHQQFLQILQRMGQATDRFNSPALGPQNQDNATTAVQVQNTVERQTPSPDLDLDATTTTSQIMVQAAAQPSREVQAQIKQDGRMERPEREEMAATPLDNALERSAQEGHMLLIRGASPGNEEDADTDLPLSDTESDEFHSWDSADFEEEDEEEDEDQGAAEEGPVGVARVAEQREGEQGEDRQPRVREFGLRISGLERISQQMYFEEDPPGDEHEAEQREREFGLETRFTLQPNPTQLWGTHNRELPQHLVVNLRVENRNRPLHMGNSDYMGAREFEQLLQQMAENDNSRRGAPPAAKTIVDGLSSISIEQRHVEDGSAVCAVCKDDVALGETVKQLPCFHLYHNDCILPWLSIRNSCPVCRCELPTDDPDYENQK